MKQVYMVLTSKPVVFQCGSLLHAQLEIWKVACVQGAAVDLGSLETSTQSSSSCGDASEGTVLLHTTSLYLHTLSFQLTIV